MSRQPKLRPKSHIPGYSDGLYDLGMVAPIADLEARQSFCEERREQRVFRVKRKHVLKACDRCRVKKTKVSRRNYSVDILDVFSTASDAYTNSAMESSLVTAARRITIRVCSGRGKQPKLKSTPEGEITPFLA